jgi:hypothetical protein
MNIMDIEKEKIGPIMGKLYEFNQAVSDSIGKPSEAVGLVHVKHVDGDCEGVGLFSDESLTLIQLHSIIVQALMMVEMRLMQERAEMPPPGTKMN